jgi:hypothetical protein
MVLGRVLGMDIGNGHSPRPFPLQSMLRIIILQDNLMGKEYFRDLLKPICAFDHGIDAIWMKQIKVVSYFWRVVYIILPTQFF